jgi:hypothetical protein
MPWFRWLVVGISWRRPGFASLPAHVGLVVDNVAQGQISFRVLLVSLSLLIYRESPYTYTTWGMNNSPVGDRSSETYSHSIDINNNTVESESRCWVQSPAFPFIYRPLYCLLNIHLDIICTRLSRSSKWMIYNKEHEVLKTVKELSALQS